MYAKIFRQIFDSSLAEDYKVRHVFMDMLVLADSDGVVDMTHEAISRRTNVPLETVCNAIETLEAVDEKSRSKEFQGSRIKRLDTHRNWGWVILNYDVYRKIATEENRKEKTRERVRKHRSLRESPESQMKGDVTPRNALVTLCDADVTFCNDKEMEKQMQNDSVPNMSKPEEPEPENGHSVPFQCMEIYGAYPRRVGKPKALIAIKKALSKTTFEDLLAKTKAFAAARAGQDEQYTCHPSTWFHQERFNDDPSTWAAKTHVPQIDPQQEIRLLTERINTHPANPESTYHVGTPTPEQKVSLKAIRARLRACQDGLLKL